MSTTQVNPTDLLSRVDEESFSASPAIRIAAATIIEHELLTDQWQTTVKLTSVLAKAQGRGLLDSLHKGQVLRALSGLSALGYAELAQQFGPGAYSDGNYVWRRGKTKRMPCCAKCGCTYPHIWVDGTPESNIHRHSYEPRSIDGYGFHTGFDYAGDPGTFRAGKPMPRGYRGVHGYSIEEVLDKIAVTYDKWAAFTKEHRVDEEPERRVIFTKAGEDHDERHVYLYRASKWYRLHADKREGGRS